VERIIIPDSTILLDYILHLFKQVIGKIVVYNDNIKKNLELTNGIIYSQKVMLKLIEKNMKREDAYKYVQNIAMKCWEKKTRFYDLLSEDKNVMKYLSEKELKDIFDYRILNKKVDFIFRRLGIK
jgi:adenylosuccinate lyase